MNSLNSSLDNKLNFYSDNPLEIIKKIIKENNITDFYWNRCYDKYSIDRDTQIKQFLQQHKINVNSFNGSLLIEPWQCKKDDGTHYKVYTPFYKELIKIRKYRSNIAKPNFSYLRKLNNSENLDSLKLIEPKHS
ncbi:DNA photolyase family protein [Francisella tularensis subsp. holarctica]|uniref:DNA photolyase family protein n=1 Tax=Francisella tularensis subsp. holarctica (strain LVS) TaxID=376619 RepID=A0AAI8FUG9_FRATH|nr:DNA photolyase family protein [Francisella tularensis subsp. holarctica LVS]AJI66139.1 DNA photolyase family protein [Francisella tularensis subsp. holarctica]